MPKKQSKNFNKRSKGAKPMAFREEVTKAREKDSSNSNFLLGFIQEKEQEYHPKPARQRNAKKDGYSSMAANYGKSNFRFDKEKFVQAGMKFVLKNPS